MGALLLTLLILQFPQAIAAQTTPQRWRLVEDQRFGAADGPQALTRVTGVLVSPDRGYLYVGQPQERTVRMFDVSSGRLLRTIGRGGAGPGEFNHVGRIGWKQDTLYVADIALQRIAMFSADGKHFRTERIISAPLEATRSPAVATALAPDGTAFGEPRTSLRPIAKGLIRAVPFVQMTRDGKVIRTITERDVTNAVSEAAFGSQISVFSQPMSRIDFRSIAPDGSSLVVVRAPPARGPKGSFYVTRMTPNGDTIYHRAYHYRPQAIPKQVVDSIYDLYARDAFESVGEPARAQKAARTFVKLPPSQPAVSDVMLASNGTVWLRRGERNLRTVEWMIISPRGVYQATVAAPIGLRISDAHQNEVWGIVHDDLDIPYVVRYQVITGPRK